MKKIIFAVLFISACLGASSQNLQTVLEKNSKALGLKKRSSIEALQTNGYFVMKDTEAKIPFKVIQTRPDKLRIETTVFGFRAIQCYDGKQAWSLSPTQGMEAKNTDTREMEFIAAAIALDGPFSINKNENYQLKYAGNDTYMEKPVEVIIWSAERERLKYYIDKNGYLVSGVRYEYEKNGGWYSMEYRIKSYMEYNGSKYPQEISAVINGVEMISLIVNKLKELEAIDMELFGKPSYE